MSNKPLGFCAYGQIAHLPGSLITDREDKGISLGQAKICTEKKRDKHDFIYVQEKLDGSCVSIANIDGNLVPLVRRGYRAETSPFYQHHLFASWVDMNRNRLYWIPEGYRACGEWLAQAHGTRYKLGDHANPIVIFDVMHEHKRLTMKKLDGLIPEDFVRPFLLSGSGEPVSIEKAMELLGTYGHHGALDPVEGAVWRVERDGKVDFLAKYIRRPMEEVGKYLDGVTGEPPVWNE